MPVAFGSRTDGSRILAALVRRGRVRPKEMGAALTRYYRNYSDADWPLDAGPLAEDDHLRELRRYRKPNRRKSTPRIIWGFAEALRLCGVPWMRGTIALYAFGRLDDVVATYGVAGTRLLPYAGWLSHEINELPELAAWSPLDQVISPDEDRLLRKCDPRTVLQLYKKYKLDVTLGEEFDEEVAFLAARQVIRDAHGAPPPGYVAQLDRAWRKWNVHRDTSGFPQDLYNAFRVAQSQDHLVALRLDEVQRYLRDWLAIMLVQARKKMENTERPEFDDSELHARLNK